MDKHVAQTVMNALTSAGSAVATTVEDLRGQLPEDQFGTYTKAVGQILAAIQLDLMAPIIRTFPDLDPDR